MVNCHRVGSSGITQEFFDNDAVAPLAVQSRVIAIDADDAEASFFVEREASHILWEDSGHQFPEPKPLVGVSC